MMFPVYPMVFYFFAVLLISSAIMVVVSRHPVRSVLFLILSFFSASVLWMLLQAEFLALMLLFVYVGAVMTLFLFVVMMLNIDQSILYARFMRFLPLGILAVVLLTGFMVSTVAKVPRTPAISSLPYDARYESNTQQIGTVLYKDHIVAFEMAGLILLVGAVSAIVLGFQKK